MKTAPVKVVATGTVHATKVYKIRKIVLVAPAADAEIVITDAADVEWARLKAVAGDSKEVDFSESQLELTGMKVPTITSSAVLLIYLADS